MSDLFNKLAMRRKGRRQGTAAFWGLGVLCAMHTLPFLVSKSPGASESLGAG